MGYLVIQMPDPEGSARDLCEIVRVRVTGHGKDSFFVSSNERLCEVAYVKGGTAGVRIIGLETIDAVTARDFKGAFASENARTQAVL
jgi:catechol 2,3-dioxygenase